MDTHFSLDTFQDSVGRLVKKPEDALDAVDGAHFVFRPFYPLGIRREDENGNGSRDDLIEIARFICEE